MFEQVSLEVGGRTLTFETGKMARQAHGAVVARYGDTVVLATACMDSKAAEKDFLPLTVDYREYTYSAGKIPGGFFKREGRPSEKEILTSRLIDRPLRPLFPEGWSNETQIVSMVLSADSENDPDVIGVTAASAALYISKIPFTTPIAAVRIGMLEGKLVVNPTVAEQKTSTMNIVVAGSDKAIVMVESGALEVSEDSVADALEFAHAEIRKIVAAIRELQTKVNVAKVSFTPPAFDEALYKQLQQQYGEKLRDASDTAKYPKSESYSRMWMPSRLKFTRRFLRKTSRRKSSPPAPSSACANSSSATICSRAIAVPMLALSIRSAKSPARRAFCRALTAPRFSPAVKRSRYPPPRSAPRKTCSARIFSSRKIRSSTSCCITTSRRSPWAK